MTSLQDSVKGVGDGMWKDVVVALHTSLSSALIDVESMVLMDASCSVALSLMDVQERELSTIATKGSYAIHISVTEEKYSA